MIWLCISRSFMGLRYFVTLSRGCLDACNNPKGKHIVGRVCAESGSKLGASSFRGYTLCWSVCFCLHGFQQH